jgi:hypothetical protein
MEYGVLPEIVANIPIKVTECMYYLYMPIKMPHGDIVVPPRLEQFNPLLEKITDKYVGTTLWDDSYLYITAKHMLVNPNFWGARGGYHSEGFGTNDINWIWYDKNPPTFSKTKFNVSNNPRKSLQEFTDQANYKDEVRYREHSLLELPPKTVYKVTPVTRYFQSTFVRYTLSKDKYNLIGNSHNYGIDYNWRMFERSPDRNYPSFPELEDSKEIQELT